MKEGVRDMVGLEHLKLYNLWRAYKLGEKLEKTREVAHKKENLLPLIRFEGYEELIKGPIMAAHLCAKYFDIQTVFSFKKRKSAVCPGGRSYCSSSMMETAKIAVLTIGVAQVNFLEAAQNAKDKDLSLPGNYVYTAFKTLSEKDWEGTAFSQNAQSGFSFADAVDKIRISKDMAPEEVVHPIDMALHKFLDYFLRDGPEAQGGVEYLR